MFLDKPVITSLTGNETVNDGSDVLFFCQGDAVPTPTAYNWFKNGVPIPNGSSANFVNSGQQLTVRVLKMTVRADTVVLEQMLWGLEKRSPLSSLYNVSYFCPFQSSFST